MFIEISNRVSLRSFGEVYFLQELCPTCLLCVLPAVLRAFYSTVFSFLLAKHGLKTGIFTVSEFNVSL